MFLQYDILVPFLVGIYWRIRVGFLGGGGRKALRDEDGIFWDDWYDCTVRWCVFRWCVVFLAFLEVKDLV